MNDAATVGRLLGEIAATAKRGVAPQVDNVVRSEVAARAARELVGYGAAWRKFEKLNPFWQ
jgi:siroheme synthase